MPNTKLQNSIDFNGQIFYVGLDVHKRSWAVTIRSLGMEVARFTQPPSVTALATHLQKNFPGGQYLSAYEAGFGGTGIHEQLCKLGISNIIVNAADIPATDKQKKNKTDLHDSRSIAERLEKKDLKGIHVLTREQQELRSLFRLREAKVKDVTISNNRLKGFLMYFSIGLPETISRKEYLSLKALEWLSNLELASVAGTITLQHYLTGYGDPQFIQTLPTLRLPGLDHGTYRMFEVAGPSMAPNIISGDRVIGEWVSSLEEIRENRVHIIVCRDGVVIKRVLNRIANRGKLVFKSDTVHHRKEYPTYDIDPSEIIEIWYARLKLSADFSEPSELYHRIADLEADMTEVKQILGAITPPSIP